LPLTSLKLVIRQTEDGYATHPPFARFGGFHATKPEKNSVHTSKDVDGQCHEKSSTIHRVNPPQRKNAYPTEIATNATETNARERHEIEKYGI
jgi:hypothetical protein